MATRETTDSYLEEVRQGIKDLHQKFDSKFDNLANLYVLREMFLPWQQNTDKRLDTIEDLQRKDKQWENDEHASLANQMVESERRIIARIDAKRQWKHSNILFIALAIIGWVIGTIEFLHPFGFGK